MIATTATLMWRTAVFTQTVPARLRQSPRPRRTHAVVERNLLRMSSSRRTLFRPPREHRNDDRGEDQIVVVIPGTGTKQPSRPTCRRLPQNALSGVTGELIRFRPRMNSAA